MGRWCPTKPFLAIVRPRNAPGVGVTDSSAFGFELVFPRRLAKPESRELSSEFPVTSSAISRRVLTLRREALLALLRPRRWRPRGAGAGRA